MGVAAVNVLVGFGDGPGFQPTSFEESWRNRGMLENEREEDEMDSSNNLEKNYRHLLLISILPFV